MHTFVPLHLNRSTLLPSWTCLHPISRNGRRLMVNCFCPFFSYGSAAGCSRQPRLSSSRGMFSLLRFFLAKCIKHFHFICYTSRNCLNHWPLWRGHDQPIPDTRHAEVSFGFSFKFFLPFAMLIPVYFLTSWLNRGKTTRIGLKGPRSSLSRPPARRRGHNVTPHHWYRVNPFLTLRIQRYVSVSR